ncbi:MAG: LOG family protein [Xanthomonadales bacterium]|nr:LOG family protein [Gammaproteobacteria bacterium]MBT8072758.1 LOG family protein [Gammaproteobacteria bacterium]NNK03600.1 LOG family protein [Xanthomonadales bacterium]NNL00059.1 LOG family protein [Xanthomonadales bacterium]
MSARIYPAGILTLLSRMEVERLHDASRGALGELLRRCALAVLNSGNESDDAEELMQLHRDFKIEVQQVNRGIRLELSNAPGSAFVDGIMVQGIRELLSAVLRDLVYFDTEINGKPTTDLESQEGITNVVFEILRNAKTLNPKREPDVVVFWGGHAIERLEYDYTKKVGYETGLRKLNICTGCGPGAMKGPMKGAAIAHSKQRVTGHSYIGISEPGIIAAESPNPIVNELVIMPDIEKRLEAFVRIGHGFVVFPGGVGTAEEILYLLGVLLNPANEEMPFPFVLTGPAESAAYFEQIDAFIGLTLGEEAQSKYEIIINEPEKVAQTMMSGLLRVRSYRKKHKDAYYFNWLLQIQPEFQQPFDPSHENMASLHLHRDQPKHLLAANLRRAFSGIVAGNVKPETIISVRQHGPFEINGEKEIMQALDNLLASFIKQNRMKLPGKTYSPCYRVVS